MTNKKLIDHCNSFWIRHKGKCSTHCPRGLECDSYMKKYGTTPFLENRFHIDRYTDEEIEDEN